MHTIGFSTGCLAKSDFKKALILLRQNNLIAVELSALRENEVHELIDNIDSMDLSMFEYISFHAPSKIESITEKHLVNLLLKVANKGWPVIVHPDIIQDMYLWKKLGQFLCLENMDKRKSIGQTCKDLETLFTYLPDATFCIDVAHSKQIDPTMLETKCMLIKFKNRLKQVHLSEVNSSSKHESLNYEAVESYRKVSYLIPETIPIILESPSPVNIDEELKLAQSIFISNEFEIKMRVAKSNNLLHV